MATVAETIKEITRKHLEEHNGLLLGQSVSAVGWINGTVPDCKNIVELPMTDIAGAYFAVGAALTGRRPILVLRFGDFLWLNGSAIVNYAGKTKEISGRGTPLFIRALSQEGKGTGALHSGKFHSLFMHMPGLTVAAPMTPNEYQSVWNDFMCHDEPYLCCEHRRSFTNTEEMNNEVKMHGPESDITLYGISSARLDVIEAAKILRADGIQVNVSHIFWLKPLICCEVALARSKCGLVVDTGFETCGASQSIAYQLMYKMGIPVRALGLEDRTVCVNPGNENLTPSPKQIVHAAYEMLEKIS